MISQRSSFKRFAVPAAIVASLILLSSTAYYRGATVEAQLAPNFVAPTISASLDVNNTGHEAFWNQVTGVQVPLTASNDNGGSTKSVMVKLANNGTHILAFAQWSAPTSSRLGKTTIEDPNNPGLFYANSTYSYDDRIVFWWSLNQSPGPPPCMQKNCLSGGPGCVGIGAGHGEGESLAGTGNLWHWKSARTDSLGSVYGKLKIGSGPNYGQPLIPSHSYADNEFINTTGHYQLGYDQYPTPSVPGNFTIPYAENKIPYNTFVVYAHGVYDPSTHMYTWEASRALHTTPSLHMVQFSPNTTYYFAVAVWEGGPLTIPAAVPHPAGWTTYGENEETKSISSWNTMALGPAAPAQTVTSTQSGSTATSTLTTTAVSTLTNTATTTVTSASTATSTLTTTAVSTLTNTATTTVTSTEYSTVAYVAAMVTMVVGLVAGIIVSSGRLARRG